MVKTATTPPEEEGVSGIAAREWPRHTQRHRDPGGAALQASRVDPQCVGEADTGRRSAMLKREIID